MDDAQARAAQLQDKLADLHSDFNQSGAAQSNPAAANEWQQQWEAQARAATETQAALRLQGPDLHTTDKLGAYEQAAQQLEAKLGDLKGSGGGAAGYDPVLGEDVVGA